MRRQPVLLELTDRRVLVVGGGATAVRKIASLARSEAVITVVALTPNARVRELAHDGAITLHEREFEVADLDGAWLVTACTGEPDVDLLVARECEARSIWSICTSNATAGSAALPALLATNDKAQVAVSGDGDPKLAVAIRDSIALLLHLGAIPLARSRGPGGKVILVGAGPGDPDLITVRGLRAIAEADVLVVDRLAPRALWANTPRAAEVIEVGKLPGAHRVSQPDVNRLIVERALAGQVVVRVKGGDPFVLGRGGEEALECIAAGVPVEVVPGITSALSVPAAAGIPATHRGLATAVLIASAHDDLARLAAASNGGNGVTLVLLMGARHLVEVAQTLIEVGRSPETPIAIIESGWTPTARTSESTLGQVAVNSEPATAPAVLVVGDVVALRSQLGDLASPSPCAGHG